MSRFDQRRERSGRRYQAFRRDYLMQNPLCAECLRSGIVRTADELDHIIPASRSPDRFYDPMNVQGLCRPHHERKTARENGGEVVGQDAFREWVDTL